jgi:hypothetical protein
MVCRNRRRSLESGKEPSGEAVAVATHVMAGARLHSTLGYRSHAEYEEQNKITNVA